MEEATALAISPLAVEGPFLLLRPGRAYHLMKASLKIILFSFI